MFRYSGSKKRMLKFYKAPYTKGIVEPFAGSAAFSCHYKPDKLVLADANTDVMDLWHGLSSKTPQRLSEIEKLKPTEKVDVRTLNLPKDEETLVRLQISGAYVGQLSSWIMYPQHSLNFSKFLPILEWYQKANVHLFSDFRATQYFDDGEHTFFVDPPYLGTEGNYKNKSGKKDLTKGADPKEILDFVLGLKSPTIFTYGEGAQETYPGLDWQLATIRKVPILRGGGTKDRPEYVCYRNWRE